MFKQLHSRTVSPEILETLDPLDKDTIKARRDLVWVNFVMGNHRWLQRQLQKRITPESRLLEIGAGDGVLGAKLVSSGACAAEQLHGLDLVPLPPHWPTAAKWTEGDILSQAALPDAEIVFCSLFLHHFTQDQLARFGEKIPPSCRLILAVEPARRSLHLWQGRIFQCLARLHPITRHDMMVSIAGGFQGGELQSQLGLDSSWHCLVQTSLLGGYTLVAQKNAV